MAQWYQKLQRPYGPMVLEISKTFISKDIGTFKTLKAQWYWNFQRPYGSVVSKIFLLIQRYWKFKDLKIQWYRKFQRPYGPVVSEISKTFLSKGIGNFKDLKTQWYRKFQRPYGPMVSDLKDLMVIEIILVKQRSLKFPKPLDHGH